MARVTGRDRRMPWSAGRRLVLCLGVFGLAACNDDGTRPDVELDDLPAEACLTAADCGARIELVEGVFLPYFSTHSLTEGHTEVTQAVVVVHGTLRDADFYFNNMVYATSVEGRTESTVVVAPHFQMTQDGPEDDEARWSNAGWKEGNLSLTSGPSPRVSSYAAIDRILEVLANRALFPAMEWIVMTGHSAGGQVAHRYAATGRTEVFVPDLPFRYVVANPSTYLYVGPERADGAGFFVPPSGACASYDRWHYGLENRNNYASQISGAQIRNRLANRDVRILVGSADTGTAALDRSCGANLQGPNRYERGRTLVRYMDAHVPGHGHVEMVVPGVGHSNRSMYASEVGRAALFRR